MDWTAFLWGGAVSGLAYWLGDRQGWRRGTACMGVVLWKLGVKDLDSATRTITFRDGTTHTERTP